MEEIQVKSPDGQIGTIPSENLAQAMQRGYRQLSPEEIAHNAALTEAGEHPIRAGIESGLSALTFGTSRELENATGLTTPEEQSLIKEANPKSSGFGTVMGIALPVAATLGGAAPEYAAGQVAAEGAGALRTGLAAAGEMAPITALTKAGGTVARATAPVLGKYGSAIAGGALEGAGFGMGQSIDEHALGDPDALGEHLLSNVGLNALVGGGIGALFAPFGSKASKFISEADAPGVASGSFKESVEAHPDIPQATKKGILESLTERKADAPEIIAIGERRGYPILEGQILASKAAQQAEDVLLSGQPTIASVGRQKIATEGFQKAAADVENVLKVGSEDLSESNIGNQIKEGLSTQVKNEVGPISELYDELKSVHSLIPLSDRSMNAVARNIEGLQEVRVSGRSPVANIANGIIEDLKDGRLKTVDDLRVRRIQLSQSLGGTASPAERNITGTIVEKLKNMEDSSIVRFAKKEMKTSKAKEKILGLLDKVETANGQYKTFIVKAKELAEGLGKKNISGAQGLLDFIENINPQKMADKIFSDSNVEFSQFMQKNFPAEFEAARKFKIGQMKAEFSKKGYLDVKAFTKKLDSLEPETKAMLFNKEESAVISDANKYLKSFPESFNPSKTAYASEYMGAFKDGPKSMIMANARDYAIEKFLKNAGGLESSPQTGVISKISSITSKASNAIDYGAKAIFSPQAQAALTGFAAHAIPDEKENKKLIEHLDNVTSDPEKMMDALNHSTQDLYHYAPATSAGVQKSLVAATKFLSSKVPRSSIPIRTLSNPYEPSRSEKIKFNRYINTIKMPTSVMKGIRHGMVTSDQMETLKAVYPQMLGQMQMAVMDKLTDHISKQKDLPYSTKLGLSAFLETNLMNSLDQQSIAMNQLPINNKQQPGQNNGDLQQTKGDLSVLASSGRMKTSIDKSVEADDS